MYPSRYMTVNEKSPYPIKRRVKGRRSDGGNEPAITLLPPDPYTVLGTSDLSWLSSPRVYRTVAPKSAKNREPSSFVILGETLYSPVQSRPGSPSGRVSPFRGHGFKSPSTTRPNSRAASPGPSPKKGILKKPPNTPGRSGIEGRKDFNRYIGLPPKSPIGGKKYLTETASGKPENAGAAEKVDNTAEFSAQCSENVLSNNIENNNQNSCVNEKSESEQLQSEVYVTEDIVEEKQTMEKEKEEKSMMADNNIDASEELKAKTESNQSLDELKTLKDETLHVEKLMPIEFYKNEFSRRSSPVTPRTPKTKSKSDKNESNFQQKEKTMRITGKPPVPPKKIGMRSTLKTSDGGDAKVKSGKGIARGKPGVRDKEKLTSNNGNRTDDQRTKTVQRKQQNESSKGGDKREDDAQRNAGVDLAGLTRSGDKGLNGMKKSGEIQEELKADETKNKVGIANQMDGKKFESSGRLVPCYQPDKCHIAPPTMASPSSIITPSISTPPTSADLAFSSTKNSQSISAAPTTVTSCSLSSVSSTVVLTGNLTRKESATSKAPAVINGDEGDHSGETKPDSLITVEANGNVFGPENKVSSDMVKAGNRDLKKEKLSEEMASATGVIKGKPDMEVLSPNNLRNSPPRVPPPNMAWDEERMPNGDVPARAPKESKLRRFISAVCRFLGCFFCCRCSPCCRKDDETSGSSAPLCCCCPGDRSKCCGKPFKCLACKCKKPKCCEGSRCCRGKGASMAKTKEKPKDKSGGKCCAKPICSCCVNCCDRLKARCLVFREKINRFCRCLFCINLICCQNLLKKCKCCHKLKCCQSNGCCSCCNPYAKSDPKKLIKKGSRASNNSRGNDQLDQVLVEHTSRMKAAIPVLPSCLAIFCLICNIFIPGLGTIISGILCLCFGKPRFSTKDNPMNRFKSFIINIIIGVAQAFTVVFCLVGWGWSIWWGVIMYKLSRRQKRLKLAEKTQKEAESSNVNQNHVDVEQG